MNKTEELYKKTMTAIGTTGREFLSKISMFCLLFAIISGVYSCKSLEHKQEDLEKLTVYAENLGLAFQVCDDILDVEGNQELLGKEVGHDEANSKSTYPALYGLEESKAKLRQLTDAAKDALAEYYDNAEFFVELAEQLCSRVY